MPALKYQRSMQLLKNTKPSEIASRRVWPIFVLLNLVLVMSLAGCASNSQTLKPEPKPISIESVIDVSDWRSRVRSYLDELTELLNSAKKTTGDMSMN